ncbi:hypothetical protein PanWU01x14_043770 [Parasponia andersonii]|uniref:F-box associated domain n=1 Tax=Parasponia andersonii TaxID=3476 RepID=A0A2P5DQ57_PARAD|nr:hypothetical protein PanWU01x14_043770 [Parasponia andersonii]
MIKIDVGGHRCSFQFNGLYCKGAYHWLNVGGQMVLSFDMSEEIFYTTPLLEDLYAKVKTLEVWKESLIIFYGLECSWLLSIFEMWVMVGDIGGVEGSTYWTKHLTIGPLVCIFYPLIFWKDDVLLLEGHDGRIVSYNLDTKRLRTLPLPGAAYPGHASAYLYLKSLVSLLRGNMLPQYL